MHDGLFLVVAIIAEIVATSALKASGGLDKPLYAVIATVGYVIAFSALALALRTIPLGTAYAIWSGVGIAALALIGWLVFRQPLTPIELAGIVLIVIGVIAVQVGAQARAAAAESRNSIS